MSTSTPDEDKYAIHAAAREGRLAAIEALLSASPNLTLVRDRDDRLPQHWATSYSHLDILRLFASHKAFDPDATDSVGWTALMMAASLKNDAGLDMVRFLLGKEADPKLAADNGGTALHFAGSKANLETVRALLNAGASARVKDRRGQTPLMRAAAAGSGPVIKVLVAAKSPISASDVDGMTALHHAVSEGHGDVAVELLRAGAEVDKKDGDGRTPLECAPDKKVREFVMLAAEREGIELDG